MIVWMAFFPDLSPYSYGHYDGENDLNVGWLEAGHDFQRGAVPDGLVEALLVCCTRPVRLYRGMHVCAMCDRGTFTMRLDGPRGREVSLGNGEIRIRDSDGRWYAAPTLVAHYVAHHEYLPPQGFVDAVLERARTLFVVRGQQFERFLAMTIDQRLEVCLAVFRDLAVQQHATVEGLVPRILESATGDPDQGVWRNGWKGGMPAELSILDQDLKDVCGQILWTFTPQLRFTRDVRDVQTLLRAAGLVERAADRGLDATRY